MRLLPRFVPPAGTALRGTEILGWLADVGLGRGRIAREALGRELAEQYHIPHVFLVSSARAGMTLLLRALAERAPGRDEVAMPGYTCYSVAASAVRAGLRVRPLDVDPSSLDIAPDALAAADLTRAVALIGTNLFGIPSDMPALAAAAAAHGAACIDDAAQCLGGQVGGRWSGSWGDAGLFSFDKGKNLTSMQGGAIVTRDADLAARIERLVAALPAPSLRGTAALAVKLIAYWVLLRPWLYWIPNRVLTLGETPFELDAPMTALPPALAPIVRRQLARLDGITQVREANARRWHAALQTARGLTLPERADARAVHPRFPVVVEDAVRRDRMLEALRRMGVGATGSYPRAILDVPHVAPHLAPACQDTPGARRVAAGMLTLPTHAFVTPDDIDRAARILRAADPPASR